MDENQLGVAPLDDHDRALLEAVHPSAWSNPTPSGRYNLVVVGAGTAGLVSAVGAAGLGAKVAIIERGLMGGDCLNFGCVPSQALIASARAAAAVNGAGEFGIEASRGVRADFSAIAARMRAIRAAIAHNDSAVRLRELGVEVYFGAARFTAADALEVAGQRLGFRRAAIATGARAAAPPIAGLTETGYLTNETVFAITALPARIALIGGGPIGCELAQMLQRLGAEVTLLEALPHVLMREDRDAAAAVEHALRRDGVAIADHCNILRAERRGTDKILRIECNGAQSEISADEIIVAAGRAPAVEELGLEAAGVEYDRQTGIHVDDYLRTSNPRIYAAGDCASALKFTHLSDAHARIVLRNALFRGRRRVSALTIPWCTYTDPEIAHVGLSEEEARRRGIAITTFTQPMAEVDRAILDGQTGGFVKIHVRAGTDQIAGATIVAAHAGEMLSELTLAMTAGVGLGKLGEVIHPYPTQAEAIRKIANQYARTRLTPFAAKLFKRWFAWTR
ncbi:MAG TPA: mercuric reductase [Candidatus Binataceae bacterium]|nr:mercuric reductase [Candidatus Binataceae bacterium]